MAMAALRKRAMRRARRGIVPWAMGREVTPEPKQVPSLEPIAPPPPSDNKQTSHLKPQRHSFCGLLGLPISEYSTWLERGILLKEGVSQLLHRSFLRIHAKTGNHNSNYLANHNPSHFAQFEPIAAHRPPLIVNHPGGFVLCQIVLTHVTNT